MWSFQITRVGHHGTCFIVGSNQDQIKTAQFMFRRWIKSRSYQYRSLDYLLFVGSNGDQVKSAHLITLNCWMQFPIAAACSFSPLLVYRTVVLGFYKQQCLLKRLVAISLDLCIISGSLTCSSAQFFTSTGLLTVFWRLLKRLVGEVLDPCGVSRSLELGITEFVSSLDQIKIRSRPLT